VSEEIGAILHQEADSLNVSVSGYVRQLIEAALAQEGLIEGVRAAAAAQIATHDCRQFLLAAADATKAARELQSALRELGVWIERPALEP